MLTDKPPRKASCKDEYHRSDTTLTINLPPELPVRTYAAILEQALREEDRRAVQSLCNKIAGCASEAYQAHAPRVRILGVRPLEESKGAIHETYGDYTFETAEIRLWMRTAVLGKATSYGTLLSTLCHELCHHLDVVSMDMPNTFHTKGFYERAGLLYHHVRGTPPRKLVWDEQKNSTFRINWPATMRGGAVKN